MFQNLVKSGRTLKSKTLDGFRKGSVYSKQHPDYSIAIARRMMAYDTTPAASEATTAVRTEESVASKTQEIAASETSSTSPSTGAGEKIIHRVKVLNLPMHEVANVKKLFTSLGLKRHKKAPAWDYAFLTFDTEEAAKEAMQKLNGLEFKKQKLATEYFTISEEAYRKRFQGKKRSAEEAQQEDTRPPAERLADQVTPLHSMPYEKQLQKKHKIGLKHLTTLKRKLSQLTDLSDAAKAQIAWAFQKGPELPFEVLDPIASPDIYGYRSKCEFTIGRNPDGERTVGFLLGLYRHGITSVLSPETCLHVPDVSKRIAKAMEDYVRASEYDVYDRVDKVGVWRTMMVKAQRTEDILILIQLKSADLTDEQLAAEKEKLVAYWTSFKDKPEPERINVTTLLLQVWNGDSNGVTDKGQTEVLLGDGYVYEELLGCRFRISSSAFFQINTAATELLYKKCAEWCNIDASKKTTLLDLCCGTGTIGITMAKTVDRVVGIEMVPDAIVDAKANAELNNVTNVKYYASKVEEKIDVVSNESNEDVVAVLDPPRNGVHSSVIRAVRESPQIQRVVFISCDANQAMQNFISLCRPTSNRFRGLPFKPTRAVSIDLFPHTDHCELMIEFVRIKE